MRHVIPVPPADGSGEVVVVEVQQHEADLQLVGCEGENPYVGTIKLRQLDKLRRKFKGSHEEWESIVSYFLLQKQPQAPNAGLLDGVRLVYTMAAERLDLSIRKDVQGIKVTLGELSLPKDPEHELNPFEWAQVSAQAHARTLEELLHLKAEASSGQGTIAKLNAQLEDFIKTKNEAETAMLRQFMELLNEKKRKIRDQSRLLAGAKLDEPTASAVQSARDETKPRRAGASRTSKRKAPARATPPEPAPAPAPAPEPDMESDSDQMEIDQPKQEEQVDGSDVGAATPDRNSDEETEDEDEPSQNVPPSRSTRATRATSAAAEASKDKPVASGPPPPARALPFGKPATRSRATEGPAAAPAPARAVEDEDETDDEL